MAATQTPTKPSMQKLFGEFATVFEEYQGLPRVAIKGLPIQIFSWEMAVIQAPMKPSMQKLFGEVASDFEKSRDLPKAKVESSWEYIEAWPIKVRRRFLDSRPLAKKESINKVIQVPSRY